MTFLQKILLKYRKLLIIAVQSTIIPVSYFLAFGLRFDFEIPPNQIENFLKTVPLLIAIRLLLLYYFDLFSGWWRYVSTEDIGISNLGLKKIYINTIENNIRNITLNKELGFQIEGLLRKEFLINNKYYDILRMAFIIED